MKVFMLGWEFPPHISGGLGTACYGITKALTNLGVDIVFVLPRSVTQHYIEERVETATGPGQETSATVEAAAQDSAGGNEAASGDRKPASAQGGAGSAPMGAPPRAWAGPAGPVATAHGTLVFRMPELERVTFRTIDAMLSPYMTVEQYEERLIDRQREIKVEARHAPQHAAHGHHGQQPQHFEQGRGHFGQQAHRVGVPPHGATGSHGSQGRPAVQHSAARQQAVPATAVASAPVTIRRSIVSGGSGHYAGDMMLETQRYAALASAVARGEQFDVVHAHDWMTFPAGIAVAAARKKPLVVHVHSTELDRGGQHVNQRIFEIEKHAMEVATHVIAVSEYTKQLIVQHYGISAAKIQVVYNGVESTPAGTLPAVPRKLTISQDEKIVLFLGRITAQKGPEHFLAAARKVVDVYPSVKFVMAGTGDLMQHTIELAANLGIGSKVLFTGFLQGQDVERIFSMADLYVMPSVSEPFGIAPLEAMSHDVPVIISKQSGVAEVVDHALKVDFWDTEDLANKIVAVLRYPPLSATLRERGTIEITQLSWTDAAHKIRDVYAGLLGQRPRSAPIKSPGDLPPIAAPEKDDRPAAPPPPKRRATPAKRKPVTKEAAVAPPHKPPVEQKRKAIPARARKPAAIRKLIKPSKAPTVKKGSLPAPLIASAAPKTRVSNPQRAKPTPPPPTPKPVAPTKTAKPAAKKPRKPAMKKRATPTVTKAAKPAARKVAKPPARKVTKSAPGKAPKSVTKKKPAPAKRPPTKKKRPKKT